MSWGVSSYQKDKKKDMESRKQTKETRRGMEALSTSFARVCKEGPSASGGAGLRAG
jgi:hypothetical protein